MSWIETVAIMLHPRAVSTGTPKIYIKTQTAASLQRGNLMPSFHMISLPIPRRNKREAKTLMYINSSPTRKQTKPCKNPVNDSDNAKIPFPGQQQEGRPYSNKSNKLGHKDTLNTFVQTKTPIRGAITPLRTRRVCKQGNEKERLRSKNRANYQI